MRLHIGKVFINGHFVLHMNDSWHHVTGGRKLTTWFYAFSTLDKKCACLRENQYHEHRPHVTWYMKAGISIDSQRKPESGESCSGFKIYIILHDKMVNHRAAFIMEVRESRNLYNSANDGWKVAEHHPAALLRSKAIESAQTSLV